MQIVEDVIYGWWVISSVFSMTFSVMTIRIYDALNESCLCENSPNTMAEV